MSSTAGSPRAPRAILERTTLTVTPAELRDTRLPTSGTILVIGDETGIGAALTRELRLQGATVAHLALRGEPDALVCVDLDPESGQAWPLTELLERTGPISAWVELGGIGSAGPDSIWRHTLLPLAQLLKPGLEQAAADDRAVVVGVSRLGGSFGAWGTTSVEPTGPINPWQGMVPGFFKSIAQEWETVRVRAFDLGDVSDDAAAAALIAELRSDDPACEVGLVDGVRVATAAHLEQLEGREATPRMTADSVVLVTGGARGITAGAALVMAERNRGTYVLMGRTPLPASDAELLPEVAEKDLKAVIFQQRKAAGLDVKPADVNREFNRIVGAREVQANLARFVELGATVEYLPCDLNDVDAFRAAIKGIYERHGRLDGVVHGAGVIEDKLVQDKQAASFERVIRTKAVAAQNLVDALNPETLSFLVFFSSVSGRVGNRGQADYAAASEVLNKLAQDLDRRWAARVVAIDWGPWESGGMMSPEVQRQFAERGITLIPADLGHAYLDDELRYGRKGESEVLVMATPPGTTLTTLAEVVQAADTATAPASPLLRINTMITVHPDGAEAARRLAPTQDTFLLDHCLDGNPVLPFAGSTELLGATAALARPDLPVVTINKIRVNKGVVVEGADGERDLVLKATPAEAKSPGGVAFDVTMSSGGPRPDYSAFVELGTTAEPVAPVPELLTGAPAFPYSVEQAYEQLLFHGPLFQGVVEIDGYDERGTDALLRTSDPARCINGVDPAYDTLGDWLIDPVLIDCALQVEVLWARAQWDITLLPAQIKQVRRVAPSRKPGTVLRHIMRVGKGTAEPICIAEHWFLDGDEVVVTMSGVEGVGSKALNRLADKPGKP